MFTLRRNLAGSIRSKFYRGISWDYNNVYAWDGIASNGKSQSPIRIGIENAVPTDVPELKFINYDLPIKAPLIIENTGRTVVVKKATNDKYDLPLITGGFMTDPYEFHSIQFHWAGLDEKGSEHVINGRRYDAELQILHKNTRYESASNAVDHKYGYSALAIVYKAQKDDPKRPFTLLDTICNKLPKIIKANSKVEVDPLVLMGFLHGTNIQKFFIYHGSFTSPPCYEAVIWNVFADPAPISIENIAKFSQVHNEFCKPIGRNVRPIQNRNGRPVFLKDNFVINKTNMSRCTNE